MQRRSFLVGSLLAGLAVVAGVRLPSRWGRTVPDKLLGEGPMPRPPSAQIPAAQPPDRPVPDGAPVDRAPDDRAPADRATDDDLGLAQPEPSPAEDPNAGEPSPPATSTTDDDTATEPLPVRTIEVICRDALGLVAAAAGGLQHEIGQLTLHHTAVPLERNELAPSRLRGHQRYHQQAGWPDVAYHYGIDLAGHVYELRDPAVAGDTFTDYDPGGHFLVVCEGDYDNQRPSDLMVQRVAELFAYAAQRFGADLGRIGGHRDHAATSCPGDHLQSRLPAIEQEASRLVAAEQVELTMLCGPAGQQRVDAIEAGRV